MPNIDQGLFKGVAVIIDDQASNTKREFLHNAHNTNQSERLEGDPELEPILNEIEGAGGHLIIHTSLPPEDVDYENYASVSFIIMDWNLSPNMSMLGPEIRRELYEANVRFIRNISKFRHAPVMIFSNEDKESIEDFLNEYSDMRECVTTKRILIKNKNEVAGKLYEVLNEWAKSVPSVLTLKIRELDMRRAINQLFIDFHDKSPQWPVIFWDTFQRDGVPPAIEIGKLINKLVEARMNHSELNLEKFIKNVDEQHTEDPSTYSVTLKRVLQGERVLEANRLHSDSISPGDFFAHETEANIIFINVRPDCDVVIRSGNKDPQLYLLKGKLIKEENIKIGEHGEILDNDNKFTIYAMFDQKSYVFNFKELKVKNWSAVKDRRLGRLLAPFASRLQQKYSYYLQRTGLPTVPTVLRENMQRNESQCKAT